MMLVVDRIEEEYVICEDADTLETSSHHKSLMPDGVREGDVVVLSGGVFEIDYEQTADRARAVRELFNRIYNS